MWVNRSDNFLMYYDEHVNDNYIPTAYESSGNGEKTVKYLKGILTEQLRNQVI